MNILGIETSCDETAAAVVADGTNVLSNVVLSQAELHGPYGGVVPEIASRSHVEALPGVIEKAVEDAGTGWEGIDRVAVTRGPGLSSSLLVGIAAAKALALAINRPLYAVNHVEAHIFSAFLNESLEDFKKECPFKALVVSGGHTSLIKVETGDRYTLLGRTIDDAAGEAFDKGACLLGLGYPGGPAIEKTGRGGNAGFVHFPRGKKRKGGMVTGGLDPDLCFSFSGLKTSLLYYLRDNDPSGDSDRLSSIAASYQEAIVDALVDRCERVMSAGECLAVGGGVSLNSLLREKLSRLADRKGFRLRTAAPRFCADNAAMIAGLAGAGDSRYCSDMAALDAHPNMPLSSGADDS